MLLSRFVAALACLAAVWLVRSAHADESSKARAPEPKTPAPWCAPELEALPGEVCFHGEPPRDGKRTLVIFLHGLVLEGAGWQHNQQRGIVRGAKRLGFSVITPRGRTGGRREGMVAWPTAMSAQQSHEAAVLHEWTESRTLLEKRAGVPFDAVFVVGFSNGAYYASSLALRGGLAADGYAVFAGGSSHHASATRRAPLFVGICSKDRTTVDDSRALRRALRKLDWPHRAKSRRVGHMIADAHLDEAIRYLRSTAAR